MGTEKQKEREENKTIENTEPDDHEEYSTPWYKVPSVGKDQLLLQTSKNGDRTTQGLKKYFRTRAQKSLTKKVKNTAKLNNGNMGNIPKNTMKNWRQ